MVRGKAEESETQVEFRQTNSEGQLVDWVQGAEAGDVDVVVLNAAAYTHTSVALRDAITGASVTAIEIHLTNIHSRESFRRKSLIAPVCRGQIAGFGPATYLLALHAALHITKEEH